MNIGQIFDQWYTQIAAAMGGLGSVWLFMSNRRKDKEELISKLIEQREQLSEKIMLLINQRIESEDNRAEIELFLNRIRNKCPECYDKVKNEHYGNAK